MQEWYLIGNNTIPNMTGGYENEGFLDCKDDAFYETLETDIADTVTIYNYDLSESKEIRGIIEGNTADTQLKSMERSILVPVGTLHSGDYIFFEDEYWIVDGRPGNNKIYEKATLKECQYKLRWQKDDGTIVERFANLTSSSKYDVGENRNNTIILTSNNYLIIMPNDKDSMTIDGKRVFIDLSDIPEKVFKITRNDDVLYNHHTHGGTLNLIADKTELNKEKDNQELWLCDYIDISSPSTPTPPKPSNPDETADLSAKISGNTNLRIGVTRTYTVTLSDKEGNAVQWNDTKYSWNVISDFDVRQTVTENKISLTVEDEDFIDSSFLLQVIKLNDSSVLSEIEITVIDVM